ncbi:unnamed protein product, partial [Prorocentrum cordatum]
AYSLSNTWESSFSNCTDPAAGPCDATPKYQYANAGLIIGPVSDIYEMLQGMETYQSDVNLLANDYYLKNPGTVTLDYAGGLFLSLHNMVNNGNAPAEVQEINGTRALYSSTLGQTVCFVQGNGNGFTTLQVERFGFNVSDVVNASGFQFQCFDGVVTAAGAMGCPCMRVLSVTDAVVAIRA